MGHTRALRLAVAAAGIVVTAGGVAVVQAAAPAHAAPAQIAISNMMYSGALHVEPGQVVRVTNRDPFVHTLTDKRTHLFDTGFISASGGTATFVAPSRVGRYPFGCRVHPSMAGTLVVGNPPDVSALTASRSATIVPASPHRLQTTLTDTTTRRVLAGLRVVLQRRLGTSGLFHVLAAGTTNSAGVVAMIVRPRVRTQFRWRFAGTPRHAPSTSRPATISIR